MQKSPTEKEEKPATDNVLLAPDQAIIEFEWLREIDKGFIAKIKSVKNASFGFNQAFNPEEILEILSDKVVSQDSNLAIIQKIEVLNGDQPAFRLVKILK